MRKHHRGDVNGEKEMMKADLVIFFSHEIMQSLNQHIFFNIPVVLKKRKDGCIVL